MELPKIITGKELLEDARDPLNVLIVFYKVFNSREAENAVNNWAKQYAVAMANPIGGIRYNWNTIREGYGKIMEGNARVYVEYHDFNFHQFNDVFYVEGRERGSLVTETVELDLKIRTSRIYKLFGNEWKQIHHHGSMENPELLQRYQQAILNVI